MFSRYVRGGLGSEDGDDGLGYAGPYGGLGDVLQDVLVQGWPLDAVVPGVDTEGAGELPDFGGPEAGPAGGTHEPGGPVAGDGWDQLQVVLEEGLVDMVVPSGEYCHDVADQVGSIGQHVVDQVDDVVGLGGV